jgi:hypothetical protein
MEAHMIAKKQISDAVRREIEVRAYLIWEGEGRPHGCEKEHWARAEAEVLGVAPVKTATAAKKVVPAKANAKAASATKAVVAAKAVIATKTKKAAKPKSPKSR